MQINRIRYSNSPIHPNPNLIKRHSRKSKTENNIDIYIYIHVVMSGEKAVVKVVSCQVVRGPSHSG
ncbi:hypothetical protein HBI81_001940 [Parastagonospora nodorum]|nr:hypothetical protein HBH43_064850 [Parastagonospora nodorum]KAH5767651.1 hypothetical protein HBI16_143840 [Parastagonospora nodorum]KAH6229291.1 hypothetical protein HBI43_048860 [Parastagonospora nodorum]KAH6268519.1 hypothetical protein HBI42_048260 [Parastagonospora nodorum]KAH6434816.1 hypothetical protein HBI08_019420 [Parastagonospora nodorum]